MLVTLFFLIVLAYLLALWLALGLGVAWIIVRCLTKLYRSCRTLFARTYSTIRPTLGRWIRENTGEGSGGGHLRA